MKNGLFLAFLLLFGLFACSSSKVSPADTGSTGMDASAGPRDSEALPDASATDTGQMDASPVDTGVPPADQGVPAASRSLALSADGKSLWVVNTESDSISQIDLPTRSLKREILLAPVAPSVSSSTGRFDPAIRPRALALVEPKAKIYVAGQAANRIIVVSLTTGAVTTSIAVGAEPTAVVATRDGTALFVVNHQSATVQKIDTATDRVTLTATVGEHPWGAALRADESLLFVSHLLINPGVTVLHTSSLSAAAFTPIPKQPPDPSINKLLPNGEVRGAYTAIPRPNHGEIWVPHLLLATDTPQPALDFQSTVFPTFTLFEAGGSTVSQRLLLRPSTVLTATGAFTDVVSGPRDIAFTADGKIALAAMAQSEDVMVFDAVQHYEIGLVRPTPSALIEGVLVDASGAHAYLQGRASHNVTVLAITQGSQGVEVTVDGAPIECLASDPMPADMRRGLRLFYSSNSSVFPITQNFWVACASCHLEGQTDAVVWKFVEGPRDTPSNAGGPINTGFLFRQAVRNNVIDYDETIRVEQGGSYHRTSAAQLPDLLALAKFTNYAIPFPQNPNRAADGSLTPSQLHGQSLFRTACAANCHAGPFLTDSGKNNPTLDLSGTVVLHDVGTCVTTGPYPDQASMDIDGHPRDPCRFDTPTLRSIFASPPYFHDGSAKTLNDVVRRLPASSGLSQQDKDDLVAYLKTL
jgi:YVTN family beta-propeller protein